RRLSPRHFLADRDARHVDRHGRPPWMGLSRDCGHHRAPSRAYQVPCGIELTRRWRASTLRLSGFPLRAVSAFIFSLKEAAMSVFRVATAVVAVVVVVLSTVNVSAQQGTSNPGVVQRGPHWNVDGLAILRPGLFLQSSRPDHRIAVNGDVLTFVMSNRP